MTVIPLTKLAPTVDQEEENRNDRKVSGTRILWVSIFLAVVLGLIFRFPKIGEGLPFFYNEDEAHHFNRVMEMVRTGDLNPHYFHKPSLHFYLRIPAVAAGFIWGVRQGHLRSVKEVRTKDTYGLGDYAFTASHPGIVKWNRALSVLFSLGIIVLAALIAYEFAKDWRIAAMAGLLCAIAPPLIEHSATIGVDGMMTFFCMLSVFCGLYFLRKERTAMLLCCAAAAGLAIGTKYNALPILFVPIAASFSARRLHIGQILAGFFVPWIFFIASSPYVLTSLPLFLDQLAYEVWHYGIAGHEEHTADPGIAQLRFYINWFGTEAVGVLGLAFCIVGLVILASRRDRRALVLAGFPLLFFGLMVMQRANFTRNMLPVLPFMCVSAAYGVVALCQARHFSRYAIAIIAALCAVQPVLIDALALDKSLRITDSRSVISAWLRSHPLQGAETAIEGELQLEPDLYKLPGVTVVPKADSAPARLYLSGYDRIVTWGSETGRKEKGVVLMQEFSGHPGPQRIVQNPLVQVLHFDRENLEALLRTEREAHPERYILYMGFNDPKFSGCGLKPDLAAQGSEDYCWISERRVRLKPRNSEVLEDLPGSGELAVKISAMSPWAEQDMTLLTPGWSKSTVFDELDVGKWLDIIVTVPAGSLKENGGFDLELSKVRSPKGMGQSDDVRRLGIAVRSVTIVR